MDRAEHGHSFKNLENKNLGSAVSACLLSMYGYR